MEVPCSTLSLQISGKITIVGERNVVSTIFLLNPPLLFHTQALILPRCFSLLKPAVFLMSSAVCSLKTFIIFIMNNHYGVRHYNRISVISSPWECNVFKSLTKAYSKCETPSYVVPFIRSHLLHAANKSTAVSLLMKGYLGFTCPVNTSPPLTVHLLQIVITRGV